MKDYLIKLVGFSVGPVLSAIISIVMIPLITFFIIPAEYGRASVFLTVQSIIIMIVTLGFDSAYVSEFNKTAEIKKLNTNCLLFPISFVICLSALCPFYYKIVSKLIFEEVLFLPIFLLTVFSFFVVLERFVLLSIRMKEKAILFSCLNIALKLVVFITTIIFIFFIRTDFLAVVYSALIGQIVFDIVLVSVFRKEISIDFKTIDKSMISALAKFGIPVAIASIVGYLLSTADVFFLKKLSTDEEIGYYSIALKIVGFIAIIQNSFSTFWTPVAFKWHAEDRPIENFEMVGRFLTAIMVVIYLAILCCKDLLMIIISQDYKPAISMIPFLIIYPVIYTIGTTTDLGIQFAKKTNYILIASFISLSLNLILNYIFIPILGGIGASFATGISYVLFFWIKTIISNLVWKKMHLFHFAISTLVLVGAATLNAFVDYPLVVILSTSGLIIFVILLYSKDIKLLFEIMAKKR